MPWRGDDLLELCVFAEVNVLAVFETVLLERIHKLVYSFVPHVQCIFNKNKDNYGQNNKN